MSELKTVVQRDALGRILPGQSLNPNGRPRRGKTYREIAANVADETKEKITQAIVKKALKGDTKAYEVLASRAEGTPKQTVEVGAVDESNRELLELLASWRGIALDEQRPALEGDYRLLTE